MWIGRFASFNQLAGWAAFSEEARRQRWIQYVNGLAGIGLITLPFALSLAARPHVTLNHSLLSGSGQAWTSAVGGLIALGLSTYQLVRVLPREARA